MTKTTTNGQPPAPGFENAPAPQPLDPITKQYGAYWVLSEEERAKGWVRPYRDSYKHVGIAPAYSLRPLTEGERTRYSQYGYVSYETYPEERRPLAGRFWTQAQLDEAQGCGVVTKMGRALSETYARDPKFYGSTFCVGCSSHFPVEQFVWTADNEKVGS